MPLVKNGKIVTDPWTHVADGEDIPIAEPVIVSADRWQADRDSLVHRKGKTGGSSTTRCKSSAARSPTG